MSAAVKLDFETIPRGSIVVFRSNKPTALANQLSRMGKEFTSRKIYGIILYPETQIQILNDTELAVLGLRRIRPDEH